MDPNQTPAGPDGPDKEKMEQIRARRLAKLGNPTPPKPAESTPAEAGSSSSPAPPQSGSPAPEAETETKKTKINITPAAQPTSNPFAQLGVRSSKPTDPEGSTGTFRVARKRSASQVDDVLSAPPSRKATPVQPESDEDYADRILSQIFRITVDPHRMTSNQGSHRLTFLPNLNQELNDSGEPLKLREPNANHDTIAPYLLKGPVDENGICFDFIKEAIKRFDDDEAFPAIFNDAMVKLSTQLSGLSMSDEYKPYVQPEVIKSYFPGSRTLDKARITNAQDALRMVLRTHQDDLFVITNAFIRAGPDTRNLTLDWFAYILNTNHKRRAIQVDPREVASDGFMMNITTILDRFCEPFMENDFSKIDKIDVRYFRRQPRVDISDETKLNADQAAAEKYYAQKEDGESNFISEAFFLTLAAHHYGSEALNSQLKNLDREIKYLERHLKAMEAERSKLVNAPHQLRLFEETLKRHTNVLEKTIALKYSIEGVLLDERMQSTSLRFMRYVAVWLLRIATGSDYKPGTETETIRLPIELANSGAFAYLPEYALQNIVDNFKFVFRWLPTILPSAVGEEMIALCITFLRSSEQIKNPYLKSSLVSLLFSGTWPFMHLKRGVLGDQLISIKFANDFLLHALMKFYIECESTGANTAFYDKFNIRYEIFQVIKCVWVNDVYRQQLIKESKVNRGFFVQFVNMLLNDTTYVLDEAFTKFPKMRNLERELEDRSLSTEDRQKKEEELQSLGSQATSYMQLANETLEMMKLFTKTLSEAFTMPEIVSRLASMLNYNLETLAGKKAAAELSVSNREKYHFRPLQLLSDFVEIYLNLGASSVFIEAVAADGRSYKPEVLDRVAKILSSRHQKDPADIARWDKLKVKFIQAKEQQDQAEMDLGDIPPEFEDPIMGELMKDPVLLPSRHVVDRSTIVQHLLSDPKDPFTRQPMTIEDAIPQTELKEKIEKWRLEKIQASKEKLAQQGNDAMDTAEG
ncbi:ubiquitin conjugation factor E4 [Trichoderma asperellum]|uniref:Ubiquitin conjugation factor E4 n=1 Tax=Trichoderma asperellum TaxID=101201 RepID=A0A6V8R0C4_TRIAP|nr:ubiquitin conjugation factor E4 [Trichoderma asperellum]